MAKFDSAGENREWRFLLSSGKPLLELTDEDDAVSPDATIKTLADSAISAGVWSFFMATYDGTADASGINLYVNGVLVASTDADDANFVSMRDKGSTVMLGHSHASPTNFYDGKMAGGPLGPFFVQTELTDDQILRLYELGARALGL